MIDRASKRSIGRMMGAPVLRHSFATSTIERTGKVQGVSEYLGHADPATTLRYYVHEDLNDSDLGLLYYEITYRGGGDMKSKNKNTASMPNSECLSFALEILAADEKRLLRKGKEEGLTLEEIADVLTTGIHVVVNGILLPTEPYTVAQVSRLLDSLG
jgi:hypothetical protein